MRLLLVDDDRDFVDLIAPVLREAGHEVFSAPDGESAWCEAEERHHDAMIVDWLMPGMLGPELIRRVRSRRTDRYTYVIMATTLSGKASFLEGMDAGADDFMVKPIDLDVLLARVRAAERILGLRSELHSLKGILPICMHCNKMREDTGDWVRLEQYIGERTGSSFSHSYCPDCFAREKAKLGIK